MIQLLGWIGSALVVISLTLQRPVLFRLVNLISAAVLLVFNIAIGLFAMVFLNVVILIVNVWQLQRLRAARMQQKDGPRTAAMLGTHAKAFSLQGE